MQAAGALCWRRGNRSVARVSMHIHASPTHRLTATTLQSEMGEMLEEGVGLDKGWGDKGNGDLFLNTLSISFQLLVWTPAYKKRGMNTEAQQMLYWRRASLQNEYFKHIQQNTSGL